MAELGATVSPGREDEAQLTEEEDDSHGVKAEAEAEEEPTDAQAIDEEPKNSKAINEEEEQGKAVNEESQDDKAIDEEQQGGSEPKEVDETPKDAEDDDELLAEPQGGEEPASELFGDEEDVEPETESRALFEDDEVLAEEAVPEVRAPKAYRREAEDLDGKPEYVTLPIDPPPATPSDGDELWILGLPMTMSIDHEIFDHADATAHEKRIIQERNVPAMKAMRNALTTGCIRAMKGIGEGELVSNTRLVEFSDGTCALFVGKSVCEAQARGDEGRLYLVEMSQEPIYHIHGTLSQRRVFKPPNVASADTRNVRVTCQSQKKTKMTTVQAGAESELKVKRHLEEQAIKDIESVERRPKKKRFSALDAKFLEGDDA